MTGNRVAVIDLGSNTFHLLISEINTDHTWSTILKERVYVRLAESGIDRIEPPSIERGLSAMNRFAEQIKAYGVSQTRAIGTAALREAKNGREVADEFTRATGIPVEIIDGKKEAEYILNGIRSGIRRLERPGLIMDIGGGSVEFILFHGDKIIFAGSYKIGVAILFKKFHHSDPISKNEIDALEKFLDKELEPLILSMKNETDYYLIGASGSFEVINDVLPKLSATAHWSDLEIQGILPYLDQVIHTDMKSRRQIPEIPIERLDYIVVAYLLIRFIFRHIPPKKLIYCDFALKEGVLAEIIGKAQEAEEA